MAIDFYKGACQENTIETVFGIRDIPPSALFFDNPDDWEAWVDNEHGKEVTHTAIDVCLEIPDYEGERCESMLTYDDTIVFIELKDRDGGRWAGKARDQLRNTIALFKRDANIEVYTKRYAHISNKQRPHFKSGGKMFSEQFENETGFLLRVSNVIKIE
jgi:hypothetical protein